MLPLSWAKRRHFLLNETEAGKLCSKCVTLAEVSLSRRHVEQGETVHPGNCAVHHGNPQHSWEAVERHWSHAVFITENKSVGLNIFTIKYAKTEMMKVCPDTRQNLLPC